MCSFPSILYRCMFMFLPPPHPLPSRLWQGLGVSHSASKARLLSKYWAIGDLALSQCSTAHVVRTMGLWNVVSASAVGGDMQVIDRTVKAFIALTLL